MFYVVIVMEQVQREKSFVKELVVCGFLVLGVTAAKTIVSRERIKND
jgi:hypothetical protein